MVIDVGPGLSIGPVYCVNQPFKIKVSRHSTGTCSTILKAVKRRRKIRGQILTFFNAQFFGDFSKKGHLRNATSLRE